jgi:hypothetical protein
MAKEAAPILLRRQGRFLVADDAVTEGFLERLPQGRTLRARDITQPRSRPRNRLYWALLRLTVDNMENVTEAALHKWMKIRLGVTIPIPLKSGRVEYVDGSISFDAMSEEEFAPYLDKAIRLIVDELLPGVAEADVLAMAKQMIGEA